jgi:hypothetical protein
VLIYKVCFDFISYYNPLRLLKVSIKSVHYVPMMLYIKTC